MSALESIKSIVGNDLLMLYGDTGTGKSKISYLLAKEALEAGQAVIFLDTERNLSSSEVKVLGKAYAYTPVFEEIKNRVANLPKANLAILDSIGLPVLIHYSRMGLRDRLQAFLDMAAVLGDLKDWTYRHNALAIVTNQPVSEFMSEDERRRLAKVWGDGDPRLPFGGKSRHVAKEIWRTRRISGTKAGTRILMSAVRSREFASGVIIAEGLIKDEGLTLNVKGTATVSEDTIVDLVAAIEGAGSLAELEAIGEQISSISVSEKYRQQLRQTYRQRWGQLQKLEPPWPEEEEPDEGDDEREGEEVEE